MDLNTPFLNFTGDTSSGSDMSRLQQFFISLFSLSIGFYLLFFTPLDPNEYGIRINNITGNLDSSSSDVQRGGLHFTYFILYSYVTFPATLELINFSHYNDVDHNNGYFGSSSSASDGKPVRTRTGADPLDPDSGGQPIDISISFEYKLNPDHLYDLYMNLGSYAAAKQRIILLASNEISNIAQEFTPQDFWQRRNVIAEAFRKGVNDTLSRYIMDGIEVPFMQILRVDFDDKFEDGITQIQVAEQQKVVNEYRQEVEIWHQKIVSLKADNDAKIASITAHATAHSSEIEAASIRESFRLQQYQKASAMQTLIGKLDFSTEDLMKYIEIKGVSGVGGKVIVGVGGEIEKG